MRRRPIDDGQPVTWEDDGDTFEGVVWSRGPKVGTVWVHQITQRPGEWVVLKHRKRPDGTYDLTEVEAHTARSLRKRARELSPYGARWVGGV